MFGLIVQLLQQIHHLVVSLLLQQLVFSFVLSSLLHGLFLIFLGLLTLIANSLYMLAQLP